MFPDLDETWTLLLRHGALSHRRGPVADADATITISRADLNDVILGTPLAEQIQDGRAKLDGDAQALQDLVGLLDEFEFWFNIVTP